MADSALLQPQKQEKLPTPSTSHLDFATIYEPAEDSFLFLDTLSSATESAFLHSRFNGDEDRARTRARTTSAAAEGNQSQSQSNSPLLVVEVGTGSGVILAFASAHAERLFGRRGGRHVLTLGVDVNIDACRGAAETVRRAIAAAATTETTTTTTATTTTTENSNNTAPASSSRSGIGIHLGIVQADLTSALRRGSVDVLLFNPPYVPTEEVPPVVVAKGNYAAHDKQQQQQKKKMSKFERESWLLALSYAGGEDGMEVTERLLAQVPEVLSARGVAYVLFCARNKAGEALKRLMAGEEWQVRGGEEEEEGQWEWAAEVAGRTGGKGGWERLEIWRIWRRFAK